MKKIFGIVCILLCTFSLVGGAYLKENVASADSQTVVVYKYGSSGAKVKQIQTLLKNQGFYFSTVDGIYGTLTVNAVKKYQRTYGLTVDGIVGSKTASYMGISLGSSTSNSSFGSSDLYLLAKVVYAEARGEPYSGKVAVAAVVLNRVRSSSFPNTISGVVYQPYAFTAVDDGQINLTPDASAKSAAQDAINGWDPTGGCIYYYNPRTATSTWIRSRPVVTTIGNHTFCL